MLLCTARLMKHCNLFDYSKQLQRSVKKVIKEGKVKTRDLGGYASTPQFTQAVISQLDQV